MPHLPRITRDPRVMGGKPCIRSMRVTVGTVVGLVASGTTRDVRRRWRRHALDATGPVNQQPRNGAGRAHGQQRHQQAAPGGGCRIVFIG